LYEEAIAGFDAKLRRFPNDAESYLYRSLARKKLGDSTGAAEDRERAIELDPDILGVT
jgi:tetratricopeptide (TPR) repeat protein